MSCNWRSRCDFNASTACGVRRIDRRLFLVFGSLDEYYPTATPGQYAPHAHDGVLHVHVLPPQGQQFSLPHAGGDSEDVERFEAVSTGCFEQPARLGDGESTYLLLSWWAICGMR
jgi:hypothetical protein